MIKLCTNCEKHRVCSFRLTNISFTCPNNFPLIDGRSMQAYKAGMLAAVHQYYAANCREYKEEIKK